MTSSSYSITTIMSQILSHVHIMLANLTQIDIVASTMPYTNYQYIICTTLWHMYFFVSIFSFTNIISMF